jgi:murein DD-endopeptidase MepM/ murein hydrolase activator NlpD
VRDPHCGNDVFTTEHLGYWDEVTWSDGDPKFPPPQLPPPFEQRPWNHELDLFDSPVVGTVTSDWGWRQVNGAADFHPGIDIATAAGTTVYSLAEKFGWARALALIGVYM